MRLSDLFGDSRRRRRHPRHFTVWTFIAPLALIVSVVIVVGVVRNGLSGDDSTAAVPTATTPGTTTTVPRTTGTTKAKKRFHKVKKGETLDTIARREKVDVDTIRALNPGLDEFKLQPGQKVRVA
jgi:LysM repeat protein